MKYRHSFFLICIVFLFISLSCEKNKDSALVLWTDVPEIALYAQLYNASQPRYKIEVRETGGAARELELAAKDKKIKVDIAAGRWLKSASLTGVWQKTDFLFSRKSVQKTMFYRPLLDYGKNGKDQFLLPVSFNLGALVFLADARTAAGGITENQTFITLDEIKKQGVAFNEQAKGVWTRMGFSPTWHWNGDFLYAAAGLLGASFREAVARDSGAQAQAQTAQTLVWDEDALQEAIAGFKQWVNEGNGGAGAEDDFIFKYSYIPSDWLLMRGRILFAYMKSNSFFTLPPEEIARLDYRWLSNNEDGKIPVLEDIIMLGITKKCKSKFAAADFVKWFYSEYTQKDLLTKPKDAHIDDAVFGICGGFSAVKDVTENLFPREYPALLSHIPPADYLLPPGTFPPDWTEIKERVVVPYIRERVKSDEAVRELRQRLGDWFRMNNRGLGAPR